MQVLDDVLSQPWLCSGITDERGGFGGDTHGGADGQRWVRGGQIQPLFQCYHPPEMVPSV